MLHSIKYPTYESIKHLEGKGNFAVSKYYTLPFKPFYRHKFKMIIDLMGGEHFNRILDFGSGSGIFRTELQRHSNFVFCIDKGAKLPKIKFDAVICASVLEFCDLDDTLSDLSSMMKDGAKIFIASPMQNRLSNLYFKLVRSNFTRNSHEQIKSAVKTYFKLESYNEWMGLYFSIKAVK